MCLFEFILCLNFVLFEALKRGFLLYPEIYLKFLFNDQSADSNNLMLLIYLRHKTLNCRFYLALSFYFLSPVSVVQNKILSPLQWRRLKTYNCFLVKSSFQGKKVSGHEVFCFD